MSETSKLLVRGVAPRLKGKIARRVRDSDRAMNDVLVQMLAEHYGLPFEDSGRRAGERAVGASPTIMLYLPADLREAIDTDAQASGDSARNVVVKIISETLDVPFKATGRWVGARSRSTRPRSRTRKQ